MNKYCISVAYQNYNSTPFQTLDIIKKSGFDSVFLKWYDEDWAISQFMQADYCKKIGLNIEFAHLGYQNMSYIWSPDKIYDSFVERYKKDLDDLKKYDINHALLHTNGKKILFPINEVGLIRFREIIDYAKKLNIKISLENTSFKEELEFLLDYFSGYDNVGLCFDTGHYQAYFNADWDISRYKNRLFSVHIHDNDGIHDSHMIPFDGVIDWTDTMNKIINLNYSYPLTLELMYMNDYINKMSIEEFYSKAFKSILEIEKMISKKDNQ